MHVEIEPRSDYLHAIVSGSFDHDQLPVSLKGIFAASIRHGLRKILIDIRTLEGEIPCIARYDAGHLVAEYRRETVLLVVLGTQNQLWPDRFFENVANNRGILTKVTADQAEALEWLHRNRANESVGDGVN